MHELLNIRDSSYKNYTESLFIMKINAAPSDCALSNTTET